MIESPYISAIQAIGWIAFRDCEGATWQIDQYKAELQKWQVSDLNVLLDCLESLKSGQHWSLEQWQKNSGDANAQLDINHIEKAIFLSKKTVPQLVSRLNRYQNKYRGIWAKIMDAQKILIEHLKNETIQLRGILWSGDGHPEIFPLGFIRRPGFSFLWENSSLNEWQHLEIKRVDVRAIWPDKAADAQPSPKPPRASVREITTEYVRLQKNPMNPKGRELRKTLKGKFPSARAKDIDDAIKIGNSQIERRRGAPKKMAKK